MPRGIPTTPENLFRQAVRVGSCLEWQGPRDSRGYGRTYYQMRTRRAHRLAWLFTHGPIPAGLEVCHSCDNPPCIDPLHLFLGTHLENMRDAKLKGRWRGLQAGELNSSARLTEEQVTEIKRLAVTGLGPRPLGRIFGVSHQHVSKILRGLKWSRHRE